MKQVCAIASVDMKIHRTPCQRAKGLDLRHQFSKPEMNNLVMENRASKNLAISSLIDGSRNGSFATDNRSIHPLFLELHHLITETMSFFPNAITQRNTHIIEMDFRRIDE